MTRVSAWGAYTAFGWRKAWRERVMLLFPLTTYVLLVVVFSSVFHAAPVEELKGARAFTADDLTWYMILTEIVVMVSGLGFQETRDAVNSGAYGAFLHQPVSFVELKLFEWAGRVAFAIPIYTAVGVGLGVALNGTMPFGPVGLCLVMVAAFVACLVLNCLLMVAGLVETWGHYSRPVFWILQKCLFLLGGLMLPLALYPEAIVRIAWVTPFPAMLFVIGRYALNPSAEEIAAGFALQLLWLGLCAGIAYVVAARADRTMMMKGS